MKRLTSEDNAREHAIKNKWDVPGKLRRRSITNAGGHEKIIEELDYAQTYHFDWDYRINVPKLQKEMHRWMDLKCLCDQVF